MSELKCQCVRCDKKMENLMDDGLQPSGGLAFRTHGHYGSTEFDPMDGSWIDICLCDDCLKKVLFLCRPPNGTVNTRR